MNFPLILFVVSLLVLHLSWRTGRSFRKGLVDEEEDKDYTVINGALLTLLGLLIGFTFSMAVSRYDQRKNYEEEEANAIGTEYLRTDLLSAPSAAALKPLLRSYLDQRILFYTVRSQKQLTQISADTSKLQASLWAEIRSSGVVQPTPVAALAVAGMNDVINREGYTQASWLNRIPTDVWMLMGLIAICSTALMGFTTHSSGKLISWVLPIAISIAFLLIADIDSPRGGVIRIQPDNLISLSESLRTQ